MTETAHPLTEAGNRSGKTPWLTLAVGAALGLIALILLHVWRGYEYWDYSEGVYALSAELWIHGANLYNDVAFAQPPGTLLFGGLALSIDDSVLWLRFAVGLVQFGSGLLVAIAVWRLTASRIATALAVPLTLLTPWAVHEHGQLTPEPLAVPLLLGAGLLVARTKLLPVAGLLLAAACFTKVPMFIPALALLVVTPRRLQLAAWFVGFSIAMALLSTLGFGFGFWENTVLAQFEVGSRPLGGTLFGYWGQAAWNLTGLLTAAVAAVVMRKQVSDHTYFNVFLALAIGGLITALTMIKIGTSINVLVVIEALMLPLSTTGAVLAWRRISQSLRNRSGSVGPAVASVLVLLCFALTFAQSAALIAAPSSGSLWLRPGSGPGWLRGQTEAQIDQGVAAAKACDPALAYAGLPLIALIADRRVRDNQPDGFITPKASVHREIYKRMLADTPVCP